MNKHDIIFLTETWLHDNIKDELINMPNYKLFRNDRLHKRGGGVCVYVPIACQYSVLSDVDKPIDIEAIWLTINCIIFCLIKLKYLNM